jgi:hypothetical protein
LPCEALDLAIWEWDKRVELQKVKDTLPKQVHDNADVSPKIKTVPKMYASVSVLLIIGFEG